PPTTELSTLSLHDALPISRVLIPRPETELLVECAIEMEEGARVHDVGTGSGAVALAIAAERPDMRVTGSDASADAVDVAVANGDRLGLRVEFVVASDWPAAAFAAPSGPAARRRGEGDSRYVDRDSSGRGSASASEP